MPAFNAKFIAWLAWYHRERPHYALKQLSPFRFLPKQKSTKMGGDDTICVSPPYNN